jgi:hypothetical protein
MPRVVGPAAGAAVWVRRMHPQNKIHQVRARLPEKSGEGSWLLAVSLHGATDPLVSLAGMRYAAIHGRQKETGIAGSGAHATPDRFDISDARRGPFWSDRTRERVAGPALCAFGDVDADSRDRNDVRYVPKRTRPGSDRTTSPRIRFDLHLRPQRISHRPRAARILVFNSAKLSRNLP